MLRRLLARATCLAWVPLLLLSPASGAGADLMQERLAGLKAIQKQLLLAEPAETVERLERFREWHRRHPGARPKAASAGGRVGERQRWRQPMLEGDPQRPVAGRPRLVAPRSQLATPPNILVNNPAGEPLGTDQSEVSLAAYGNYVVAAWNDGIGYDNCPDCLSTQGFGYSTDGGTTWVDGDTPPGLNVGRWSSDPVVAVDEKTGVFYFSALCEPSSTESGIGVVAGSFCGGTFAWGTPVLAARTSIDVAVFDKEWTAVDSLTGNVYVSYSHFDVANGRPVSDRIRLVRSTDGGLSWSAPQTLSRPAEDGLVQGSRPAAGPGGEVYVVWHAIGDPAGPGIDRADGRDFLRLRKSTDFGASFAPEVTVESIFTNFGSGAPGWSRGLGIAYPGIAVDRSNGPHRGRVYVAWNEAIDFYDAPFGDPSTPHYENSGQFGDGNDDPRVFTEVFTVGEVLAGFITIKSDLRNPGDWDYWRFHALQGQTVVCYLDQIGAYPSGGSITLDAALRIFCADAAHPTQARGGGTRLAFSQNGIGGKEVLVYTVPADGDYYLRVASAKGQGLGSYRILTAFDSQQGERSRDHRDVFVTASDDGVTWGPPVRANDSPGYFDDWFPEVAVDGLGRVYMAHYDYRDSPDPCGGAANVYVTRSDDGGVTWIPERRVTDTTTYWSTTYSTVDPNQGDYLGLFARDTTALVAWTDGRVLPPQTTESDPNVYMAPAPIDCPNGHAPVVPVGTAGSTPHQLTLTWTAPAGFTARLIRRTAGVDLDLGPVTAEANGQIVYQDFATAPGVTYSYRLQVTGYCEASVCELKALLPCDAAPVALKASSISRDSASVTWSAPAGLAATVYRRSGTGDFVAVGQVTADTESLIAYLDLDVAPGHSYTYRLGVQGFCEAFAGQVTLTLPGFALYGAQPNPTPRDVNVYFSLDDTGAPATLELFDVSGRTVHRVSVGWLGAGPHLYNLTLGGQIKGGVYFMHLTQSGRTLTRRVLVTP